MSARRGGKKKGQETRLALFVEGAPFSDMRGREALSELWKTLCAKCRAAEPAQVVGFSKGQLRKMQPNAQVLDSGIQALDLLVAQHYDRAPFDRVIIAFDALPANQEVVPTGCQHKEVDFVLRYFEQSEVLPPMLRDAATALRRHYATPRAERVARAPLALEILYMEPNFEGLLVSDEPTAKLALVGSGKPTPKERPKFDTSSRNPDRSILPKAVECAAKEARDKVRGPFPSNKHGWAEYIIRHAKPGCRLLSHPIGSRLGVIGRTA